MKKIYALLLSLALFTCVPGLGTLCAQDTIVLPAMKDNTLYEYATGDSSNGAGNFIFVGKTNKEKLRRALIAFDISGNIPEGSIIESVRLTLHLSRTGSSSSFIRIHELMRDWGEGTSDAPAQEGKGTPATDGDATWIYTFFNTGQWSHPGGDFFSDTLATTEVKSFGDYTWSSTSGLVGSVQKWLNQPDENFGWILIGSEEDKQDVKRFDSRELDHEPFRPRLQVVYSAPVSIYDNNNGLQWVTGLRAYPNPFSDITTIEYKLAQQGDVEIKIMNILGQGVLTLVDEYQTVGTHSVAWDGNNGNGKKLNNGIYYSYIRVGKEISVIKILKTQ